MLWNSIENMLGMYLCEYMDMKNKNTDWCCQVVDCFIIFLLLFQSYCGSVFVFF